jgi:hypothetical protein
LPHGFKGLILGNADCHIVVVIVGLLIDLVLNNNLILFVPQMQEDALVISAFGFSGEVLAVLDGSEEDLHPLVDLVEGLDVNGLTIKAVAAACGVL